MYATIFKETDNRFVILDPYRKGMWELNRTALDQYVRYCTYLRRGGKNDNSGEEHGETADWVRRGNAPPLLSFESELVWSYLDRLPPGIVNPPLLILELTRRCNYRCPYCYAPAEDLQDTLSLDELTERVVKPFVAMGGTHWALTGGEPMMVFERTMAIISAISQESQRKGFVPMIGILTSGWHFADRLPDLVAAGLTHVQVSIASLDPDRDRTIRGNPKGIDTANESVKALEESVRHGIFTETNTVLHPETADVPSNIDDIPAIAEWAMSIGVHFIRFLPIVPAGRACRGNLSLRGEDAARARIRLTEVRKRFPGSSKLFSGRPMIDSPLDLEIEPSRPVSCRAGIFYLYLDANGRAFPCNNLQVESLRCDMDTVRRQSLFDIWFHSPTLKQFRRPREDSLSPACTDCNVRAECVGECRAFCWYRYGKLDLSTKPSPCYREISYCEDT